MGLRTKGSSLLAVVKLGSFDSQHLPPDATQGERRGAAARLGSRGIGGRRWAHRCDERRGTACVRYVAELHGLGGPLLADPHHVEEVAISCVWGSVSGVSLGMWLGLVFVGPYLGCVRQISGWLDHLCAAHDRVQVAFERSRLALHHTWVGSASLVRPSGQRVAMTRRCLTL